MKVSRLISITGDLRVLDADPSDDRVLETALLGDARFLVTGDRHLLKLGSYEGVRVLRAADPVRLIVSR